MQGDVYQTDTHLREASIFPLPPAIVSERRRFQGANMLGRMKRDMNDGALLTVQSYLDFARINEPTLLDDRRITFDTEAQYDFAARGAHEFTTGGNYRLTADDEGNTGNISLSPGNRTDNLFGVFLQDKIALSPDKLYLTLGTKLEHNDYSGFEYQPNARLSYIIDADQTVWGAVSRAVRTPSRYEHDVTFALTPTVSVVGNTSLDSEDLVAYEIGYRKQVTPQVSVDVATFYNVYDNLAVFTAAAPNFTFDNAMDGHSLGGEVSANWDVTDSWRLSGTYSYINLSMSNTAFDAANGAPIEDDTPHHQGSLRSSWNISRDWSFDTSAYYVGRLPQDDIDPYVRLDMRVGWQVSPGVTFAVVGQNLLQDEHMEFGGATRNAAEIERSFYGKLTWEF